MYGDIEDYTDRDEVIDHSESGIPFKITMDTFHHEDVLVTGTFSVDEDGEFYCFDTFECKHYLDEDDMVALLGWINDDNKLPLR